jgi:signal peptidase I
MDNTNREVNREEPVTRAQYSPTSKASNSKFKDTLSTLGVIILAPLVAFFLTAFVFQSYQVDGPSMETTLQDSDRLIVSKTEKTISRITGNEYTAERYDVIIFNHSGEFGDGQVSKKQLIKRVIGLPGDRVEVKEGVVKVFNDQNPDGYLVDRVGPEKKAITNTPGNIDETINEGEIYVMGDNRENSLDSRSFGSIRNQDIVGKLSLRIYPFDKTQKY